MKWQRPKTIKLYLSPPDAERLITLWPDFKIINKKVMSISEQDWKNRGRLDCFPKPAKIPDDFGLHFLFGPDARPLNWKQTAFDVRADGIPVHAVRADSNGFALELESFCAWQRSPETFAKLTVRNTAVKPAGFDFGVLLRTAFDETLGGIGNDYYASYNPRIENWWFKAGRGWKKPTCPRALRDGSKAMRFRVAEGTRTRWIERAGELRFSAKIKGRGTAEFFFLLGDTGGGDISRKIYATGRRACIDRWQKELGGIANVPRLPNRESRAMFHALVCQCLQMFAWTKGRGSVPRQGGRYQGVWPTEAVEFLTALDRIRLTAWSA